MNPPTPPSLPACRLPLEVVLSGNTGTSRFHVPLTRLEGLRSAVVPSAATSMIHEHARPQIWLLFLSVPSPLQGYDESYTETAYESYDSYYSQPQA